MTRTDSDIHNRSTLVHEKLKSSLMGKLLFDEFF
jgi:hypothetical protein